MDQSGAAIKEPCSFPSTATPAPTSFDPYRFECSPSPELRTPEPPKCTALGFWMLLSTALFIPLVAHLCCAASSPTPRYVVDVRRPRGLAPRQNLAGVMLDGPDDPPGTGITPLVLAGDHRCALSCPILARAAVGSNLFARLQLILCHHCCGEHQLQARR